MRFWFLVFHDTAYATTKGLPTCRHAFDVAPVIARFGRRGFAIEIERCVNQIVVESLNDDFVPPFAGPMIIDGR